MGGENVLGGNTCGSRPAGTNNQELPPPSTRRGEIVKACYAQMPTLIIRDYTNYCLSRRYVTTLPHQEPARGGGLLVYKYESVTVLQLVQI